MTEIPPPLTGQERHEAIERSYLEEDRYWAAQDRLDRHAPAPDCVWTCEKHGDHRCITGCPRCKDTEYERRAAA